MTAIALSSALSSVQSHAATRAASRLSRDSGILAALSTALELARQVGDQGSVSAKTIASVRKQMLAA